MSRPRELGGIAKSFFFHICEGISPYTKLLNARIRSVSRGAMQMSINFDPILSGNPHPQSLHGGVTATLMDHAGGFCAWTTCTKPGVYLSTADISIQYLAPLLYADEGLVCDAHLLHSGDSLVRVNMTCWDLARSKKIAEGRAVYIIYQRNDGVSNLRSLVINKLFLTDKSELLSKLVLAMFNKFLMIKHKISYVKRAASQQPPIEPTPVLHAGVYNGLSAEEYARAVEVGTTFGREILQLQVDKLSRGELVVRLPFKEVFVGNFLTPCLHGGVPAAVIDHCGGFCARTLLDDCRARVSTVALHLDYLAPVGCFEDMYCSAKVVSETSDMIKVDICCWDQSKSSQLVIARALFNIYTPKTSY